MARSQSDMWRWGRWHRGASRKQNLLSPNFVASPDSCAARCVRSSSQIKLRTDTENNYIAICMGDRNDYNHVRSVNVGGGVQIVFQNDAIYSASDRQMYCQRKWCF